MRDLVDRMLGMIDRGSWSAEGDEMRFAIAIANAQIDFDIMTPTIDLAFERLAVAIEATIAAERTRQMIEAAGTTAHPPPLWLVSGSDILAKWLVWAGASNALRNALTLTNDVGMAPVAGDLDRRARRELGQGGAKIRVRGGVAIAERIELSDRPRCTATLGERARIRIEHHKLPDTLIAGLQRNKRQNALRPLAEVVSHPFFTAADLRISGVANDGAAVVFTIESQWAPLEPMPAATLAALPADADPMLPWRATAEERRQLDGLVAEGRHRAAATGDPR